MNFTWRLLFVFLFLGNLVSSRRKYKRSLSVQEDDDSELRRTKRNIYHSLLMKRRKGKRQTLDFNVDKLANPRGAISRPLVKEQVQVINFQIKVVHEWRDEMSNNSSPAYELLAGNIVDAFGNELTADYHYHSSAVLKLRKADRNHMILADVAMRFYKSEGNPLPHIHGIINKGWISGQRVDPNYFVILGILNGKLNDFEKLNIPNKLRLRLVPPPMVMTTPTPPSHNKTEDLLQSHVKYKEIKISIKLKQLYGMFLSDRKSPEYRELSGNVEQAIYKIFARDSFFLATKALGFRESPEGRCIAVLAMDFKFEEKYAIEKSQAMISSGDLAGMPVDDTYLIVNSLSEIHNGGVDKPSNPLVQHPNASVIEAVKKLSVSTVKPFTPEEFERAKAANQMVLTPSPPEGRSNVSVSDVSISPLTPAPTELQANAPEGALIPEKANVKPVAPLTPLPVAVVPESPLSGTNETNLPLLLSTPRNVTAPIVVETTLVAPEVNAPVTPVLSNETASVSETSATAVNPPSIPPVSESQLNIPEQMPTLPEIVAESQGLSQPEIKNFSIAPAGSLPTKNGSQTVATIVPQVQTLSNASSLNVPLTARLHPEPSPDVTSAIHLLYGHEDKISQAANESQSELFAQPNEIAESPTLANESTAQLRPQPELNIAIPLQNTSYSVTDLTSRLLPPPVIQTISNLTTSGTNMSYPSSEKTPQADTGLPSTPSVTVVAPSAPNVTSPVLPASDLSNTPIIDTTNIQPSPTAELGSSTAKLFPQPISKLENLPTKTGNETLPVTNVTANAPLLPQPEPTANAVIPPEIASPPPNRVPSVANIISSLVNASSSVPTITEVPAVSNEAVSLVNVSSPVAAVIPAAGPSNITQSIPPAALSDSRSLTNISTAPTFTQPTVVTNASISQSTTAIKNETSAPEPAIVPRVYPLALANATPLPAPVTANQSPPGNQTVEAPAIQLTAQVSPVSSEVQMESQSPVNTNASSAIESSAALQPEPPPSEEESSKKPQPILINQMSLPLQFKDVTIAFRIIRPWNDQLWNNASVPYVELTDEIEKAIDAALIKDPFYVDASVQEFLKDPSNKTNAHITVRFLPEEDNPVDTLKSLVKSGGLGTLVLDQSFFVVLSIEKSTASEPPRNVSQGAPEPTAPTTPQKPKPLMFKEIRASIRMKEQWNSSFSNNNSMAYTIFSGMVEQAVDRGLMSNPNYIDSTVLELTEDQVPENTLVFVAVRFRLQEDDPEGKVKALIKTGSLSGIPVDENFFEVFSLSETDHPKPPDEAASSVDLSSSATKGQKQPATNLETSKDVSQVGGAPAPSPKNASEIKTEIPVTTTAPPSGPTNVGSTFPSIYPTELPPTTYSLDNGPTAAVTSPPNSLPALASDRVVTVPPDMQTPSAPPQIIYPDVSKPEDQASKPVHPDVSIPSFATTASTMTAAAPPEKPGGSALSELEGTMVLQQNWHPYLSDKSSNVYRVMEQTVVSGIKNIYAQSNEEVIPQIISFNEVESPEAPWKNGSDTQVEVHFKIMFLPGHKGDAAPIQNAIDSKSLGGMVVYPTSFALKTSDTVTHPLEYTSCQQLHNIAMSAADGQIGGFIPECTPDGNFKSVQCHALTGFCWCVNHVGVRIIGTEERYKEPHCDGMILTGKAVLPDEAPSTLLPGSCLTVSLQEQILCGGNVNCHLPLLGNKTFKNVVMVDRAIDYSLPLMQLKPGTYVVTAVLNVGWCRISSVLSKDLIHEGDYHSTTLHDVVVGTNTKIMHKDIELELVLPEETGITLSGDILLPNEAPDTLPSGSCLIIQTRSWNPSSPVIGNMTVIEPDILNNTIAYSMHLPDLDPGDYMIRCVLHLNSCDMTDNMAKPGEYFTEKKYQVSPDTTELDEDLELVKQSPFNQGVTVQGRVILPTGYSSFSRPSCLTIKIQRSSKECPETSCLPQLVKKETFDVQPGEEYNRYSTLLPNALPGKYFISAVLNDGWCAEENIPLAEGEKFNDLYSIIIYDFMVKEQGNSIIEKDIELAPFSDYSIGVTLHGRIQLPPTANRYASTKSCLILQVREFNPSFGGNSGIDRFIAQHVSHQLQYEGELIHYAMQLPKVRNGRYQIDAIMNVGWCSGEISGSRVMLRSGDYHNSAVEDFMILEGERHVGYDFEMSEYNPKPEPVPPGVTVYGKVILPTTASPLSTNSCLTLQIKEFRECTGLSCSSPTISRSTYDNIQVLNRAIQYDIYLPNISSGHFIITAVINNGWCFDGRSEEWIKNGDFINEEIRHFIVLPHQIDVEVDIQLNHFVKLTTTTTATPSTAQQVQITAEPSQVLQAAVPPSSSVDTGPASATPVSPPVSAPASAPASPVAPVPVSAPAPVSPASGPASALASPVAPPAPASVSAPLPPGPAAAADSPAPVLPAVPPLTIPATPPPVQPNISVPLESSPTSLTATASDGNFDYQFTLLTNPNYVETNGSDEYVYRTGLLSLNTSEPITNESNPHLIVLPNGLPKSCQGIRDAGIGNIDGQYIIEARPNCHISVICVNMDDEDTKEFLGGPSEEEWRYWHYAVLIKISESDKKNLPSGACLESSRQGRELLRRILVAGSRDGNPIGQWKTKISEFIKRRKRDLPDKVSIITKPRLIRKENSNRMWTTKKKK